MPRWFIFYILCLAFVFCLIDLPLSGDEAHYWEWAQSLDFSYYSKGPLTAFLIRLSTSFFGNSERAIRLPTFLSTLGSLFLFYNIILHRHGKETAKFVTLVCFSAVGFVYPLYFMTTDGTALFLWLLSLFFYYRWKENQSNLTFILMCSALGLGIWSKYTTVILLVTLAYAVFKNSKSRAKSLLMMFSITAFFLFPILYWNSQHEWVNFLHNQGHVVGGVKDGFRLRYVFDFFGSQTGLYGMFWVISIYLVFFSSSKALLRISADPALGAGLGLFLVCFFVSFTKIIYPNWTIPAYALLLIGLAPSVKQFAKDKAMLFKTGIILNLIVVCIAILLLFDSIAFVPGRYLPTKKVFGWRELVEEANKMSLPGQEILTDSYTTASMIRYYSHDHHDVLSIPLGGRRMNQFDVWNKERGFDKHINKDFLVIVSPEISESDLAQYFKEVIKIKEFSYDFHGTAIRERNFYSCKGFKGYEYSNAISY